MNSSNRTNSRYKIDMLPFYKKMKARRTVMERKMKLPA